MIKRKLVIEIEGNDGQGHVDVKWKIDPPFAEGLAIPDSGFVKFTSPLMSYLRSGVIKNDNTLFVGADLPKEEN